MQKLKRRILSKELWLSFIAIMKYIPDAFRVKEVDGMQFYSFLQYDQFRSRVENMTIHSPRQWGTMNVQQMFHHLNLAIGAPLGFYQLPDESYLLSRTLFKWILVDWYPAQPVGLHLPLNFMIPHNAVFDFDTEKRKFLQVLDKACHATSEADFGPHCFFGEMNLKEWGKLSLIHIDYHLKQFDG